MPAMAARIVSAPAVVLEECSAVALTGPGGHSRRAGHRRGRPERRADMLVLSPCDALERLGAAYLTAPQLPGSDSQAGRKVLDRFQRVGIAELRTEAKAAFVP